MDRETRAKHLTYDFDNEMDIIRDMQKCQRNWDYTRTVHPQVRDYLLWIATNSPSKQHEGYYDVYWSDNRDVLNELSKYTWGCTHSRNPPSTWRNSQMNAPLYILYVAKEPNTELNCNADGTTKPNIASARWENAYVSIGISLGLVMRAAQKIGYATGANKSHNDLNGDDYWEKRLGILDDVILGKKKIAYGVGIGFPKSNLNRWESEDTELALGAGNGSNLTTKNLDVNPRTKKPFRKIKIVNIKECAGKNIKDPYGNEHLIPDKAEIKINTYRNRNINAIEIK